MTEHQRRLYRLGLLQQLREAAPHSMSMDMLTQGQKIAGFRETDRDECQRELNAMAEGQLVKLEPEPLNRAIMNATLLEAGRVVLSNANL